MNTPWGQSDGQENIADGIICYSTSSHGGILLSPKRHVTLQEKFPHFTTFAGGRWYEEDCDIVAVMLAFPNEFDDAAIRGAIRAAHSMAKCKFSSDNWLPISQWLVTPEAAAVNVRMDNFEAENADKWEAGSMGSCEEGWDVSFTRVRDKASQQVIVASYPRQRFYSDEELDNIAVDNLRK